MRQILARVRKDLSIRGATRSGHTLPKICGKKLRFSLDFKCWE